jgi:hypothetical protein
MPADVDEGRRSVKLGRLSASDEVADALNVVT